MQPVRKPRKPGFLLLLPVCATACGSPGPGTSPPPPLAPRPQPPAHEVIVAPAAPPAAPRSLADLERDLALAPGSLEAPGGPAEFRLEAGDALSVQVISHPQFNQEVTVAPDGRVSLAKLGSAKAQGLTLPLLEEALRELCREAGLKDPALSASLKAQTKRYVTIIGLPSPVAGGHSGQHEIRGSGTLLETLAAAGWTLGTLRSRRLSLIRQNRSTMLDLADIARPPSPIMNIALRTNDTLIFLEQPPFFIRGEMSQPGPAAIPEWGFLSLEHAIVLGGGIKPAADVERAQLARANGQVERVNLNRYLYGRQEEGEIRVYSGDELYIPASKEIGVYVFGMVPNPGLHRRPGRITVSQAIAIAGHAQFGAVLSEMKLVRGYPAKPQVFSVNFEALTQGDLSQDMELQEGDVLYVPESTLSDVLDVVARVLGPLSGTTNTAVGVMTLRRLSQPQ